jgi:nucleotide-binding universal stress UspA family protein
MSTAAPSHAPATASAPRGRRVLVLHEPGPAGTAALDLARELDLQERASLTVVAVAPTAPSGSRCGGSAVEYNTVIRETVADDLDRARERLGPASGRADYVLLVEDEDPSLEDWVAARDFDLILLPARRRLLRASGHPAAARLGRVTDAEVRVVKRSR